MSVFELLPSPGAADELVPKKSTSRSATRHKVTVKAATASPRASLRRFQCPCGCERRSWFSQPRSLRAAPPADSAS
ncbi:MAG: hypothetical protein ACO3FH_10540 [Steroidobacteraceae bacterium]